jgi:2C-methyl-D-erythritol 2,4-cyclodiphosphate synthase
MIRMIKSKITVKLRLNMNKMRVAMVENEKLTKTGREVQK